MKTKIQIFSLAMLSVILTACSAGNSGGQLGDLQAKAEKAQGEKRTKLPKPNLKIADLTTDTGMQKLYEDILTQKNIGANCGTATGCDRDSSENSILGAYNQSYSSYAVVRTTYAGNTETAEDGTTQYVANTEPVNSYIALLSKPTKNRAAIVDATYTGRVSYSDEYRPNVVSKNLTMQVSGDNISGSVIDETGSGKLRNRITFENAAIQQSDNLIHFTGEATFHREVFLDMGNSKDPQFEGDIKGSYQGAFAGENGEEVIGNFHSNNLIKAYSIQGAFGAKRK